VDNKSSNQLPTKEIVGVDDEERAVVNMYRAFSRWEKNALHLLMYSLSNGTLIGEATDHLNWPAMRKLCELPDPKGTLA
jgi:hypothetical protein